MVYWQFQKHGRRNIRGTVLRACLGTSGGSEILIRPVTIVFLKIFLKYGFSGYFRCFFKSKSFSSEYHAFSGSSGPTNQIPNDTCAPRSSQADSIQEHHRFQNNFGNKHIRWKEKYYGSNSTVGIRIKIRKYIILYNAQNQTTHATGKIKNIMLRIWSPITGTKSQDQPPNFTKFEQQRIFYASDFKYVKQTLNFKNI